MARLWAWLGGTAFVLSLIYTVYFYAVALADSTTPPPRSVAAAIAWNLFLFGVFAVHHSVLARPGPKRWVQRLVSERLERSVYVWAASALLVIVCIFWAPVPGVMYDVPLPLASLFYAAQIAGVVLIWRATAMIDPLELAGIRQVAGSNRPVRFRASGPFGLVRHPIYLGWMLVVCATPRMTANRLLFAAISSLYLILAIPWEEKSLVEGFGDRYRAYQAAVRWRLVPGIW